MERTLFSADHDLFRQAFRQFVARDVRPHQERWREAGCVDKSAWRAAGGQGFLCPWLPEDLGGAGGDFLHSTIITEELGYAYESGFAMTLHSDICAPYLHSFGTPAQQQRWLPGCASGELVLAIAMTEPGTGSDLAAIKTSAVRDGDDYVVNGAKTFISNGQLGDLVIVAVKTDPDPANAHRGISLIVVEADRPGFVKGKKLAKMGLAAQDTSELFFEDCRVPVANRLGPEGAGFLMMMQQLQQERLVVAMGAQAVSEQVIKDTLAYVTERTAFGKPIGKFQNTQFKLAECATRAQIGRAFLDELIRQHVAGKALVSECSMAKWWLTDTSQQIVDECLQLFGGYGYMLEYPVARAFVDARVQRIFAGTNEIMKVIIAKQMGL